MAVCPNCETTREDTLAPCPTGDGYYCVDEAEYAAHSDDRILGRRVAERFIVSAILGRGSMGKVYKARQDQVDRDVALKVFRAETLVQHSLGRSGSVREHEAAQARFVQEARVLGKLSHPNCVTVYDFGMGKDDPFLYIAMEFVAGVSLRRAMNRGLKFDAIVEIVRQILRALREAHSLGIVHRDLKPENIVLSYRFHTGEHLVKVLDFGIAKLLQSDEEVLTRVGALFGTPAYMSPEQCRGEVHTIGAQVDIYALGCILYEMVCGQLPYPAQLPQQMVRLHQEAEIPALNPRRGLQVPAGLEAFIQTCLAKDRQARYADAEAALGAFEQVVSAHRRESAEFGTDGGAAVQAATGRRTAGSKRRARGVVVPENHLSGEVLDPVGKAPGRSRPTLPAMPAEAQVEGEAAALPGEEDAGGAEATDAAPRVKLPSSRDYRATVSGRHAHGPARDEGRKAARRRPLLIAAAAVAVLVCGALTLLILLLWVL